MKATKLTYSSNGRKVWREDAFEGGMSRADLIAELEKIGFVHYIDPYSPEGNESWELYLPDSIKPSSDGMHFLWVSLDIALGVKFSGGGNPTVCKVVDSKIMEFSSDTLIAVCMLEHNSRAYRLGDLWQGIRQQWELLCHYDAICKGEYKVKKLVRDWDIV